MHTHMNKPTIQCDTCNNTFTAGTLLFVLLFCNATTQCPDQIHCLPKPLLFGDHFLHYHCETCTQSGTEEYKRDNMSWVAVVHLVIYNLICRQDIIDMDKPEPEKRHKYFRWKDDICAFIDDYWDYLVPGKKSTTGIFYNSCIMTHSTPHFRISYVAQYHRKRVINTWYHFQIRL